MKILYVFFAACLVTGIKCHTGRRYKSQPGKLYDTSDWNQIVEVSSIGECGSLCTHWDSHNVMCPLFQTIEAKYEAGEKFRGYKCHLLLDTVEYVI